MAVRKDPSCELKAISTDLLEDHEANCHVTDCDQTPSRCVCPDVNWIWAYRPERSEPIRSGKWMLFPNSKQIDNTWNKVKDLLASGKLGFAAKVAPLSRERDGAHLICVYTNDHQDVRDVFRVLVVLLQNRLANYRIHYKTDEATLSGVYGSDSAAISSGRFDRSFKPKNKNYRVSKYSALKVNDAGSETDLLKSIKMYLNNIGPQFHQGLVAEFAELSVSQQEKQLEQKCDDVVGGNDSGQNDQHQDAVAAEAELVVTIHDPPLLLDIPDLPIPSNSSRFTPNNSRFPPNNSRSTSTNQRTIPNNWRTKQ